MPASRDPTGRRPTRLNRTPDCLPRGWPRRHRQPRPPATPGAVAYRGPKVVRRVAAAAAPGGNRGPQLVRATAPPRPAQPGRWLPGRSAALALQPACSLTLPGSSARIGQASRAATATCMGAPLTLLTIDLQEYAETHRHADVDSNTTTEPRRL